MIKLGGSLLGLPNLAERLRLVLRQISVKPLLIVGGGEVADVVRRWEDIHSLSNTSAHWLAVQAMDFNRSFLETLLPESAAVSNSEEAIKSWKENRLPVLNTSEWLKSDEERSPRRLPYSWDVTSDSIAAWAAIRWRAAGLVLLKSVDCPRTDEERQSAVDAFFCNLAREIPQVSWCNLLPSQPEITLWESFRSLHKDESPTARPA